MRKLPNELLRAVEALKQATPMASVKALVITHLTPRRMNSLKRVLELRAAEDSKLEIYLTNPALQALQSLLGRALLLLTCMNSDWSTARSREV